MLALRGKFYPERRLNTSPAAIIPTARIISRHRVLDFAFVRRRSGNCALLVLSGNRAWDSTHGIGGICSSVLHESVLRADGVVLRSTRSV